MTRVLVVATALVSLVVSAAGAAPQRTAHDCVKGGELWFRAADGTRLVGHRFGKGRTAVILTHQSEGDLCDWLPYAKRLAARGYVVFPIDFRGYGFSSHSVAGPGRFPQDIAAATKALRKLGVRKVFVVGASMGGIAALVAATQISPPLDGVVSVSSPRLYGNMNGIATAKRLQVPVLYLAATADDNAGYDFSEDAQALHRRAASKEKRLVLLPGPLHGIELVGRSPQARAALERFLRDH
jgi:alpha-beta hydrolase superfamily lysophospholipase